MCPGSEVQQGSVDLETLGYQGAGTSANQKIRCGYVTSDGWERTIGEAQSWPSNVGERERLHISETLHLPTVGVLVAQKSQTAVASLAIDRTATPSRARMKCTFQHSVCCFYSSFSSPCFALVDPRAGHVALCALPLRPLEK